MLLKVDLCRGDSAYINVDDVISIEQTRVYERVAALVRMRDGKSFEVKSTADQVAERIKQAQEGAA